jgi:hypothetical protein
LAGATGKPPPRRTGADHDPEKAIIDSKDDVGVMISAKQLNDLEAADALESSSQALQQHWASFTFYLMASLSIFLPLFLLGKLSLHHPSL